jgi:hypothetical protein
MITQSLKHNAEMPFMLFLVLRIDQDVIDEETVSSGESSLQNIFFTDLDLMITRSKIKLQEHLRSNQLIEQKVNAGQWILVLHSHRIEWSVIDAHTKYHILLHKESRTTPW